MFRPLRAEAGTVPRGTEVPSVAIRKTVTRKEDGRHLIYYTLEEGAEPDGVVVDDSGGDHSERAASADPERER